MASQDHRDDLSDFKARRRAQACLCLLKTRPRIRDMVSVSNFRRLDDQSLVLSHSISNSLLLQGFGLPGVLLVSRRLITLMPS